MKAIITIILVVFFGTFAFAQDAKTEVKVDTIEMGVVLTENVSEVSIEIEINNDKETARLYKFKNSRVKKALVFATKRNASKFA